VYKISPGTLIRELIDKQTPDKNNWKFMGYLRYNHCTGRLD